MFLLVILLIILIVAIIIYCRTKRLPLDSVVMVNGGVGSGKTSTAVYLAIKSYKKELRAWKFRRFMFYKLKMKFRIFKTYDEEPMLYSNIPLARVKYVPFTTDLILREKRFNYKSVVLISESSLIANSMSYKDNLVNDRLTLFIKLCRHELKGTYKNVPNVIVETQSLDDNHYSFDRCITQSLFLTKKINIPFFRFVKARELSIMPHSINTLDDDLERSESFRWLIIPKSVFKKYDSYCYSVLTDDKETITNYRKNKELEKDFHIASLLNNSELKKYNENLEKENKSDEREREIIEQVE